MLIPRNIKAVATKVAGRSLLKVQKFSPEILTAVGIAGFVTTIVLVAKASTKVEETVDHITEERRVVNRMKLQKENGVSVYSEAQIRRELVAVYVRATKELGRLYGPSFVVGTSSIVSILAAHGIMRRRNVGLMAAYAVLEKSFGEYRKRVIEEFGEDKDIEFRTGVYEKEISEDGTSQLVLRANENPELNEYQRIFSKDNINWDKNHDYNVFFLSSIQNYMNDRLKARGHVFLNEILDQLGFEHTPAGAVVGWLYDSEKGDGFIDFGMEQYENIVRGAHIDGTEGHIYLEFNVDGTIFDKI